MEPIPVIGRRNEEPNPNFFRIARRPSPASVRKTLVATKKPSRRRPEKSPNPATPGNENKTAVHATRAHAAGCVFSPAATIVAADNNIGGGGGGGRVDQHRAGRSPFESARRQFVRQRRRRRQRAVFRWFWFPRPVRARSRRRVPVGDFEFFRILFGRSDPTTTHPS